MSMKILGTGSSLPKEVVTNDYLSTIMETSDEWISTRTGIRSRHLVREETTTSMAAEAAEKALCNAGISAKELDLIIVATLSPDKVTPSAACEVQAILGAEHAFCFDINAACSGFLYGANTAAAYMGIGMCEKALVIGTETLSKIMDWNDRSTCVLFGDGAGAAVLAKDDNAVYEQVMGSDGTRGQSLYCEGRRVVNPLIQVPERPEYVHMDGQEVFKFAVTTVPQSIHEVLSKAGADIDNIKYFILHQANERILKSVSKRLKVGLDRFPVNLDSYGNTSSATIPILLDEMNQKGMLNRGDQLVLAGFGGGLTWSTVYLVW